MSNGRCLTARATHASHRAAMRLGLSVGIAIAALIAINYAYFKGFDDGADASLCVMAIQIDGSAAVNREPACRHIQNRTPPPRIFPGRNGDEPTIWKKSA